MTVYLAGLVGVIVAMTALWLFSLRIKDASIVDIVWGLGFVLAALIYAALTPDSDAARSVLSLLLVGVWGVRLAVHIGRRNIGKGEDPRYVRWRRDAGAAWWWQSYVKVFLLQGALLWIISAPLYAAQASDVPLNWLDWVGVLVWLVGFAFEAVGDWQLAQFKANPANKGKVLDTGLWRYTRHPNYFGDAVLWWGIYIVALAAGGWWTIFAPTLMTYLLVNVSGVAHLEPTLKKTKPQYAEYIRRTSAFIPRPPKA